MGISKQDVEKLLSYDPASGSFFHRVGHRDVKPGDIAGCLGRQGYIHLKIKGKRYFAHRVAWLLTYGHWPVGDTDHINQNKSDNRIENLREATRSQNKMNHPARRDSLTHCRGITPRPQHGNYQVRIQVNGKRLHIGVFKQLADAARAYDEAAKRYHGDFNYRHSEAA